MRVSHMPGINGIILQLMLLLWLQISRLVMQIRMRNLAHLGLIAPVS